MVPPSGTWERRRADVYAMAADWLGPIAATEEEGLELLLKRYLAGFGPGRLADAANWAGVPAKKLQPAAEKLNLRRFEDEEGKELLDLPRAPLPDAKTPAPARFLPVWDAILLAHARRAEILAEEHRPLIFTTKTPQSVNTFLVDGAVAGKWSVKRTAKKAELLVEPFETAARQGEEGAPVGGRGARPLPRAGRRDSHGQARRISVTPSRTVSMTLTTRSSAAHVVVEGSDRRRALGVVGLVEHAPAPERVVGRDEPALGEPRQRPPRSSST